jgi:zinc protease
MKNIFFCFFLTFAFTANAQTSKPYDMMVNGVKVIVVPSGNEIVQIDLVIKGGVQNYPADKAGIEQLAMTGLTECGTQKDSKNSFKNKLDEVDAQVYGYTGKDASHMVLNCIKGDFELTWPLYVDALTVPKFDEKEFARIKEEAVNQLRQQESNPDAALRKMAMETAFKGMDYSKSEAGTIPTIQKLTPQETKAYFTSLLTRSRIFVVVVGDISKAELQKKMGGLMSKIPAGKPFQIKRGMYEPKSNTIEVRQRELATNYIAGISAAPSSNSPDYYSSRLASGMFYNKMFLEVRTNYGLSYAPAAYFTTGLTPYSMIYVSTKEPDKYIAGARNLVDKIKKEGFAADDVKNMKNSYVTRQYSGSETNASLASMVATSELLQGDWHKAFTLKQDLQPVTAKDVNKTFNKYIGKLTWVYMGDPKKVTPSLYTQPQTPPIPKDKKAF